MEESIRGKTLQLDSRAANFKEFCELMTAFAENQLDFHREKYYGLSRQVYGRIMSCYEQPRLTNEETDKCAATYRQFMQNK
jgi:hypothetical protein